jgi:SIR2-like domain
VAAPTTSADGEDIRSALAQGNLVLFVGAGLSMGAGLPGWPALVRPLAQSVGYRQFPADDEHITTDHLISAAQHYENQHGRIKLIEHLRERLDTTGKRPTTVHQLLASCPVRIIFTTNFDDLIEQALREARRRFNRVVATEELAFGGSDEVQVIKLCGELDRPASIVFTRDDYNTYFDKHPRLAELLRMALESHTALFLGYSLQDPFLNQIWAKIGLDFGKLQRHAFAVTFDVTSLEVEDLRRRGIHLADPSQPGLDKNHSLEAWLRGIAPEGSGTSALQVDAIAPSVPALIPRPPVVGFATARAW